MGVKSFTVELRPSLPIYFPAQEVKGVAKLETSSAIECREVTVRCRGKTFVYWTESRGKTTKAYSVKEYYGEKEQNVLQGNGNAQSLQPGVHEFDFSFVLPSEAPSSFEGTFGYVRYKIDANLKIPRTFDKKAEAYFSFCQPYDLNRDFRAKEPLSLSADHKWGKGPMKHGPIKLVLNGPSKAGVPGSTVDLEGTACNQGSSSVDLKVSLKQKVAYYVKKKTKTESRVLSQRTFTCPSRESIDLDDLKFKIPAVVPHLQFCKPIDLQYVLQVKTGSTMSKSVKTEVSFYLGTLPLISEENKALNMYKMPPADVNNDLEKKASEIYSPTVSKCYFSGELKVSRFRRLKLKGGPPNYVVLGQSTAVSDVMN